MTGMRWSTYFSESNLYSNTKAQCSGFYEHFFNLIKLHSNHSTIIYNFQASRSVLRGNKNIRIMLTITRIIFHRRLLTDQTEISDVTRFHSVKHLNPLAADIFISFARHEVIFYKLSPAWTIFQSVCTAFFFGTHVFRVENWSFAPFTLQGKCVYTFFKVENQ